MDLLRQLVSGLVLSAAFAAPAAWAGKVGVYDYEFVEVHVIPGPDAEDRFHGPDGEAIRAEIRALYEGIDALSESARTAREAEIRKARQRLFQLKPDRSKERRRRHDAILTAVHAYATSKGYEVVYDSEFLEDAHGSIVVAGKPTDITEGVIDRLVKEGLASRDQAAQDRLKAAKKAKAKDDKKADKVKGDKKVKLMTP